MSADRGDCEHGHAIEVLEMARVIGADHGINDHGIKVRAAVLVIATDDPEGMPTVIGRFNTTSLFAMAGALLEECAEHKPDGCRACDASALTARDMLRIVDDLYLHHMRK